jgi:hypothetical protein
MKYHSKSTLQNKKANAAFSQLFFPIGIIGTVFSLYPDPYNPSLPGIIFSWVTGLLVALAGYWYAHKPKLSTQLIMMILLGNFLLAGGIQGLRFLPYSWIWIAILIIFYCLAWVLPKMNMSLSRAIFDELFTPKTRFGRFLRVLGVVLISCGGILGAALGRHASSENRTWIILVIVGICSGIASIILAQVSAYQLWVKYQDQKVAITEDLGRAG